MRQSLLIVSGLLFVATLSSCASEKVRAENKKAKEESAEYVDYYPTGSNIPVKVRKDQLKSTDAETAANEKALTAAQQRIPNGEHGDGR